MKKAEFIKAVAEKLEVTQKEATDVVAGVFETIEDALVEGKTVTTTFGKLSVTERAARKGHNPSTGQKIDIPASKAIKLKVNKHGKELVN